MATTITLTVAAMSKSKTVSSPDITRILNSLKTHYGQVFDPTLGTPVPPSVTPPGAMRDRTNQEVFDLVANGLMQGLIDIVARQEGNAAAAVAMSAIVPVSAT